MRKPGQTLRRNRAGDRLASVLVAMAVIPVTLGISLGLVVLFVALFWRERARAKTGGAERDSLQPLAEETPRPVGPAQR